MQHPVLKIFLILYPILPPLKQYTENIIRLSKITLRLYSMLQLVKQYIGNMIVLPLILKTVSMS